MINLRIPNGSAVRSEHGFDTDKWRHINVTRALTTHHVNGVTGTEEANINEKRETMNYHCESLINLKVWFSWAEALNPALRRSCEGHETNPGTECLSERCFSVTMDLNDRPHQSRQRKPKLIIINSHRSRPVSHEQRPKEELTRTWRPLSRRDRLLGSLRS